MFGLLDQILFGMKVVLLRGLSPTSSSYCLDLGVFLCKGARYKASDGAISGIGFAPTLPLLRITFVDTTF
jgi:hypothetical protein